MYLELHAASAFSFLEAASLPEALVARAADLGYSAMALIDRDGVSGVPRFHQAATKAGIRPLIGCELTIQSGGRGDGGTGGRGGMGIRGQVPLFPGTWCLPVLVASPQGYRHLCRLITRMKLAAPKGEGALTLDDLDGCTGGLIALVGRAALVGGRYGVGGLVDRLVGLFGRGQVYVELQRHFRRDEESDNHALVELASAFHVPVVATNGVRFATPDERPLYDVLTCIRHKTDLDRAGRRLAVNAERYLKPPDAMARLFADHPKAVAASRDLADRLDYTMANLGYHFPEYPVPAGETMMSFLRKMTEVGARDRYRPLHERARTQLARELDLIEKLDLAGYFLIVWDIVNFCRQQNILVQGRGSAANSAVCYSLGITAVDPVGMELLFERFLSEERGEWPDIDLDLPSGDRRERVIQHVYQKYGKHGAAMTANVITYRGRSAAREVGKALGIEADRIDRLAKLMNNFEWTDPRETLERHLEEAGFGADCPRIPHFVDLWQRMQDLPRHLGQHSGGMVICQGRLDEVVPLENATMPGRVVVQWDKDDCADMGIVKVDLLGLGMLAALQDAIQLVNQARLSVGPAALPADLDSVGPASLPADLDSVGPASLPANLAPLDLAHLPPDDPAVYRMLQEADTIGLFQVESRAQMATLPRLRPDHFYDIVVQVAIIRPGPIVGQMVHPFLARRAGREAVVYPHPSLEPILKRTLGVPLFQEQLLRMAMVAAGFTGGEAEELRRAMGFKRSEARMRQIEQKLRAGIAKQGISGDAAEEIVRSITSFALYGFPESHAASFALIVYASAYLKAHYPAAFYTALLNNQPMGFYHPATLVKDAQRRGVRFASIDVQHSRWPCTIEPDGAIRLGLRYVSGLREEAGRRIESAGPPIPFRCPKCGCDDESMIEEVRTGQTARWFCSVCSHDWSFDSRGIGTLAQDREPASGFGLPPSHGSSSAPASADRRSLGAGGQASGRPFDPSTRSGSPRAGSRGDAAQDRQDSPSGLRFGSVDDLIARTALRRDELATLAEIGALNSLGYDRRSALWQIERAVRPAGELFERTEDGGQRTEDPDDRRQREALSAQRAPASEVEREADGGGAPSALNNADASPLAPMTLEERIVADYEGTGLTIGPHPMALRRSELSLRGVWRARDLPHGRHGRRVRVAGAVITRQRPGTAKGFVFLTLEDETGIANIIVQPDTFASLRRVILEEAFLLVEGVLQIQDGVTAIKADRMLGLGGRRIAVESHDFH